MKLSPEEDIRMPGVSRNGGNRGGGDASGREPAMFEWDRFAGMV